MLGHARHRLWQHSRLYHLKLSEVMTNIGLFHSSSYRNFKAYYITQVMNNYAGAFPCLVSYQRFVNLLAGLVAYTFREKKPSLNIRVKEQLHFRRWFSEFAYPELTLIQGVFSTAPAPSSCMLRQGQMKRLDGRDAIGQAKFVANLFGVAAKWGQHQAPSGFNSSLATQSEGF